MLFKGWRWSVDFLIKGENPNRTLFATWGQIVHDGLMFCQFTSLSSSRFVSSVVRILVRLLRASDCGVLF